SRIAPLTNKYGATPCRKLTTFCALNRIDSSADGKYDASSNPKLDGVAIACGCGCAGTSAPASGDDGRIGTLPVSSAVTIAAALEKRPFGSFSRHIMTARARSCGTSLRRCDTGVGRSEMCFTSMAGVLVATNGGSPTSIWYATMPSE